MMAALAGVTREEATRYARAVDEDVRMPGGLLEPMSGSVRIELGGLAEVEAFLIATTAEELAELGTRAKIHHLDFPTLVTWVRDTVGDRELADRLDEVVATGRPFGMLVPEAKQLLADRLSQYEAALAEG